VVTTVLLLPPPPPVLGAVDGLVAARAVVTLPISMVPAISATRIFFASLFIMLCPPFLQNFYYQVG
jgi:hypothetical protein